MANYNVRLATSSDIDSVQSLFATALRKFRLYSPAIQESQIEKYSAEVLTGMIESDPLAVILVEDGATLVSICISRAAEGVRKLSWLLLVPGMLRREVPLLMVKFHQEGMERDGVHKLVAEVLPANRPSNYTLMQCGFVPTTLFRRHWYDLDFVYWEYTKSSES